MAESQLVISKPPDLKPILKTQKIVQKDTVKPKSLKNFKVIPNFNKNEYTQLDTHSFRASSDQNKLKLAAPKNPYHQATWKKCYNEDIFLKKNGCTIQLKQ